MSIKLTNRQRILLREASIRRISDLSGDYYRVGGYGTIPIRYDGRSYPVLQRLGLVEYSSGGYAATEAGRSALRAEREGE